MIGTVVGTMAMCVAQGWILRGELGGIEGRAAAGRGVRMLVAAARSARRPIGVWYGLDDGLGRSLPAQTCRCWAALAAGLAVYAAGVWVLRVPEAGRSGGC